jgi:CRP/FNR family transcriptional regulator, nitrogen oxide reductase regulator
MRHSAFRAWPLFRRVPASVLHELARTAREGRVPRGGMFYEQGALPGVVHLLIRGRVKLTWVGSADHRVILGFAEPGDPFDLVAMALNMRHTCSARAVEDCQALTWPRSAVLQSMERCPQIAANALRLLASRLAVMRDAFGDLATSPVEPRLARALTRLTLVRGVADGSDTAPSLRLGQRDLAACIGTTPYTVSRILSQWRREGLVDVHRERVVIQHLRRLEDIARTVAGPVADRRPSAGSA